MENPFSKRLQMNIAVQVKFCVGSARPGQKICQVLIKRKGHGPIHADRGDAGVHV